MNKFSIGYVIRMSNSELKFLALSAKNKIIISELYEGIYSNLFKLDYTMPDNDGILTNVYVCSDFTDTCILTDICNRFSDLTVYTQAFVVLNDSPIHVNSLID